VLYWERPLALLISQNNTRMREISLAMFALEEARRSKRKRVARLK